MLAGRLVRAARDILDEYNQFKIPELLAEASTLAAQRGQLQENVYTDRALNIRKRAQAIVDQTKLEQYPSDLLKFLKGSEYSTALPEYVGTLLRNGFPDNRNFSLSSGEVNLYGNLVSTLRSELGILTLAAKKLNIEEISIPPGDISFDILIPRSVFENRSDKFLEILRRFDNIMAYFIELTTGSEGSPTLTYTSTSEPVFGLAVAASTGWSFLLLYKLLLEVAEKQISLLKTIKDLRSSQLCSPTDLENQVKAAIDEYLAKAVDTAITSSTPKISEERVNEIKVAINKDAKVVVHAVANGARVGITIESLENLSLISKATPEITPEIINQELEAQRKLENSVRLSVSRLGEPASPLLTNEVVRSAPQQPNT